MAGERDYQSMRQGVGPLNGAQFRGHGGEGKLSPDTLGRRGSGGARAGGGGVRGLFDSQIRATQPGDRTRLPEPAKHAHPAARDFFSEMHKSLNAANESVSPEGNADNEEEEEEEEEEESLGHTPEHYRGICGR